METEIPDAETSQTNNSKPILSDGSPSLEGSSHKRVTSEMNDCDQRSRHEHLQHAWMGLWSGAPLGLDRAPLDKPVV